MDCYKDRIAMISKQLEEKSLGEIQSEMKTNRYNYTGVGFGYQLRERPPKSLKKAMKFAEKPEFDKFLRSIKEQ